jgi:NitT/TauT family transport system permease protein
VASEAISVGSIRIALPGIGSYVAVAIQQRNLGAVGWAIAAMTVTIVLYDQLLFRPLVAWADKFRFEQTALSVVPRSWLLDLLRQARVLKLATKPFDAGVQALIRRRFSLRTAIRWPTSFSLPQRLGDIAWLTFVAAVVTWIGWKLAAFGRPTLRWADLGIVASNGMLTLLRVAILIVLASIVWVPIGVTVGLRPRLAEKVQPVAQFLAAFPANLLFPIAVYLIVTYHLMPKIWLSPLMILGTQWYILFNVIAGATAFPSDFREAAATFHVRGWRWWRQVMLPGVFPYYVTGAITASGGAWNASIVSEAVSWGPKQLSGSGLGAYIAQMTTAGDYPRIALGVALMSVIVITLNRLIWRPLYAFAERRTRLD